MIVQNTLIGRSKQSIGNVVATTLLGKNVLKAKPLTVANPKTEGQINQRAKLSAIVSLGRIIADTISAGFKEMAIGMYAFNAFVSTNTKNTFVSANGGVATYTGNPFVISKGTISAGSAPSAAGDISDNEITISWDGAELPVGASLTDNVLAVCFNQSKQTFSSLPLSALRSDGVASFPLPPRSVAGDSCRVSFGFANLATKKACDSQMSNAFALTA